MVQSGNKLQGCPELYRNLLLTAERHPGLHYSYEAAAHQPTANKTRYPVKESAGGRLSPICFVKNVLPCSLWSEKDMWKKKRARVRTRKQKNGKDMEKEQDAVLRQKNWRGKGTGTERERFSWKMRLQKAFYVQERWPGNFQMSETSHLPSCKAALYGSKC